MSFHSVDASGCVVLGGAMVANKGGQWFGQERFLTYLEELTDLLGPVEFFAAVCEEDRTDAYATPIPDAVQIHPVRFSLHSLRRKVPEALHMIPKLYQAARRRRAVIHFFPAALTPINQLLLRRYTDAYVTYYKSDWIAWTRDQTDRSTWKLRFWSAMEQLEARLADASVFRSDAHRRRLAPTCRGITARAQPILSTQAANDGSTVPDDSKGDSKALNLLFVGVLQPYKGLKELIDALAMIDDEASGVLPWRLHLVGAPHADRNVESTAEIDVTWVPKWLREPILEADLESKIVVHGYIDDVDRLQQIYRQADLFVLPSWTEGFPRVIDEAMSFGLPVVTTPVGGIPDQLSAGEDALFVEPQNPDELAQVLHQLMRNKEKRLALAAASRKSFVRRVRQSAAVQHAELIDGTRTQRD